jgi:hypothetical protein
MGPRGEIAALLGTVAARPGAPPENLPLILIALPRTDVTRRGARQAGARRPETTLAQIGEQQHAASKALPADPLATDKAREVTACVGTAKAFACADQAGRETSFDGFVGHACRV